jgi:hypothetical protein
MNILILSAFSPLLELHEDATKKNINIIKSCLILFFIPSNDLIKNVGSK